MGDVYRFPGGEMPPDFETKMPDDIEVKHCYRHPDRETGVSCSNCGRPICHECMIPAPVGFRCPECVKEQNAARLARQGRHARPDPLPLERRRHRDGSAGLSATKVLIGLNVAIFVLESHRPSLWRRLRAGHAELGALWPRARPRAARVLADVHLDVPAQRHSPHRSSTCGLCGSSAGSWSSRWAGTKFVILYFISGFAGSVLVLVAAPDSVVVGASGAIFGIFGALAVHAFLNRGRDFQSRSLLGNVLFLLVINLVFSFMGGISWQAPHRRADRRRRDDAGHDARRPQGPAASVRAADGLAVRGIVFLLVLVTAWQVADLHGLTAA